MTRRDPQRFPMVPFDRKLEANIQEKGDAAELVLDGQLLGEDPAEVNLAELLQIAKKEFAQTMASPARTIDERELEKSWSALRTQLARAMQRWHAPAFRSRLSDLEANLPLWQRAA